MYAVSCMQPLRHLKANKNHEDCTGVILTQLLAAGQLTCSPNKSNPRDLDISIEYSFKGKNSSAKGKQEYRMR